MAEHVWSILCDRSIIDKETNSVSLLNVVESVRITVGKEEQEKIARELEDTGKHPIIPVKMYLVTWWVRSDLEKPENVEIQIANYAPSGERGSITVSGMVDLESYKGFRITAEIGAFVYRGDGRYWIVIEYKKGAKWRAAARLPIHVSLVTAPGKDADEVNL